MQTLVQLAKVAYLEVADLWWSERINHSVGLAIFVMPLLPIDTEAA